ncbi:sodium/myo-inositol cotransporter 2-like [Branchiostoma floridae]|uniref:Sodium/myo-inositol cotransporter 2 n=1 Tax=Branchiostoma floridae TaxID=7739 RepID=A0A9J7KPI6_BRAFL|nr:sodium/myo-inositol cotransporter 2-like [Branchiostoma floridae]
MDSEVTSPSMETFTMATNSSVIPGSSASLDPPDIAVLVVYFFFILGVGLWSMYRTNRGNVDGYFLAGRDMVWWAVGASLFSSNVGSGHFVGLAGSGAAGGIAVGGYEWNGMLVVLMMAWLFLPVYIAGGVYTMPEYLKKRYGGNRLQIFLAILVLFIYIFTKISVDMYAGAIYIQQSLGWNIYLAIVLLLALSAVYTVTGGLAAVIYTDTAQTVILFIGCLILMILAFIEIGGFSSFVDKYMASIPDYTVQHYPNYTCGIPRADSFHLLRDPVNSDFPWPGTVLGMTINSIWYWCADQVIIQRCLAAKNMCHAKAGAIMCSYMKILPMFLMIFPGMISRSLFPNEIACQTPEACRRVCNNPVSCTDIAYPKLVLELMPTGLKGLMMAAMIAALMSSLTSIFNSGSTIFTMDVWRKVRRKATERELMIVGRVFVCVLVVISVLWVPIIQSSQGAQLFVYIQVISSYLQPPVTVVFVMGIFWKRANEQGAFWGLMLGLGTGLLRMTLDFIYPEPACGEPDTRPDVIGNFHYLYFAIFLAGFTLIVQIIVTLLTPPPSEERLVRLTWWTRFDHCEEENEEDVEQDEDKAEQKDLQPEKAQEEKSSDKEAMQTAEGAPNDTASKPSLLKRGYQWFCGFSSEQSAGPTAEEKVMMTSIKEPRTWRLVLNINLVFVIAVALFLWGFFA